MYIIIIITELRMTMVKLSIIVLYILFYLTSHKIHLYVKSLLLYFFKIIFSYLYKYSFRNTSGSNCSKNF